MQWGRGRQGAVKGAGSIWEAGKHRAGSGLIMNSPIVQCIDHSIPNDILYWMVYSTLSCAIWSTARSNISLITMTLSVIFDKFNDPS